MNAKVANKQMIERELWLRGRLSWKMHAVQREMYDIFNNSPARSILVWLLARQSGKSYMIVLMCLEMCLQNPGSLVALITDTKLHLEGIFEPLFQDILRDCPEDIKPEYHKNKFIFYFPNGSQIHLAGSDAGHAEKLRGKKFAVVFIDEAGFCSKLRYNIRSVILPTLTHTRGRIVMATTPPEDPEHEFIFFMERAELNGLLTKKTIYDNPLLKREDIKSIEDELGVDSVDFKREYLCQIIRNESLMVIPEFDEDTEKALVQVVPKPQMFSGYVSMDLGYKDLSVVLFGYYNFELNKVVIEKEITVTGKKLIIPEFTQKILDIEREVYTNDLTGEFMKPVRVSDINYLVTQEISRQSGRLLNFEAPRKDEKGVMVNFLRTMIKQHRVLINPECKVLISHLRNAKWKNSSEKLEFARSADFGHFDACFIAGTKILTKRGYVEIENVNTQDEVLTHTGEFKKVTNVMNKEYEGEMIKLKPSGRDEIICTPNHSFYTGIVEKNKNPKNRHIVIDNYEWVSAEDIDNKHKLYIPNIISINTVDISNEMCFLYGYYVAEGSLGGNGYQIEFSGHKNEVNVCNIIEKAIKDKYGEGKVGVSEASKRRHLNGTHKPMSRKLRYYLSKTSNSRKICISQKEVYNELRLLGRGTSKHFPDFIFDLSPEQSFYMLSGYLFGDGHFSKTGIKSNSVSEDITNGVDFLSRKIGLVGIKLKMIRKNRYKGISRSGMLSNDTYTWSLSKKQSITFYNLISEREDISFIFKDKLIHELKEIQKVHTPNNLFNFKKDLIPDFKGTVYNLEVEDNESYTVNDVAVHNCDALIYLLRRVDFNKNPYPSNYNVNRKDLYVVNKDAMDGNDAIAALRKIFGPKKKNKY